MAPPAWITFEKREGDEYKFFRREFRLPGRPDWAEARLASKGHCGLFLNGRFVESTVARHPGRVNRHEVTALLRPGINVIALKLGGSYFRKNELDFRKARGFWESQVALELRAVSGKRKVICLTDDRWRCSPAEEAGWTAAGFDDRAWSKAEAVQQVSAEEYERLWRPAALWQDYGRTLPPALADAERLRAVAGEAYVQNVGSSPLPPAIPTAILRDGGASRRPITAEDFAGRGLVLRRGGPGIILDWGRAVVGHLAVEFAGPVTARLRFEFDFTEDLADFTPEAKFPRLIARLAVEADLKRAAEWFNLRRRAFRYLKITLLDSSRPVALRGVTVRPSAYPAVQRGWFRCSDESLNRIWEASRYTLRINMHQEYESCPRREMLAFSGDVRLDGLVDFAAHGEAPLLRSFFHLVFAPGRVLDVLEGRGLWDYPAWWNLCLHDYYLHSGDAATVREVYPTARLSAEWYAARLSPAGLLYQPAVTNHSDEPGAVEYTCAEHRLGYKPFLNALVAETFSATAGLARVAGRRGDAARYAALAKKVARELNRRLWDEKSGAYRDALFDAIPQDGNVLPVLFGQAPAARARRALATLKRRHWSPYGSALFDRPTPRDGSSEGTKIISPLMCAYEAAARFRCGRAEDALDLVRRCWGGMLKKGAGTFWEYTWNDATTPWQARAHAWSAGPAWLLPAWVLGVRPLAPGFRRVLIQPQLGGLAWAEGVVPTPQGPIAVRYERREGPRGKQRPLVCRVILPGNERDAEFDLPRGSLLVVRKFSRDSALRSEALRFGEQSP